MKTIFTTLILMITLSLNAQNGYEKAMTKGLELMKAGELQAASQQFERVVKAEKENWLPAYYAALSHVQNSWGQVGKEKTLLHMKKAQEFIGAAELLAPNNPEIMVLQGMLNTCWIQYDSKVYGMKLSGATTAIYEKAAQMAPNNPRVASNQALWLMGSAQFFGKDITPYCSNIDRALVLFNQETPDGFQPRWGLDRALKTQKDCVK
jgi:tetratricopeptide (TPR) repeat protein